MSLTLGVDLGTTNSAAAYHDGQKERVIENAEGQRYTPSVVAYTAKGGLLVGRPALSQLKLNPDFTYQRFKRVMGKTYVSGEAGEHHLVEGPDGEALFSGPDCTISPQQLSSEIVKSMLDAAEMRLRERPTGVVITHPAPSENFEQNAMKATIEAARLAGVDPGNIHLLPEPVAAAIAYGLGKTKMETIMVFDCGGGTTDCSIMRVGGKDGATLHEPLDSKSIGIGGMDFDKDLTDWAIAKFAAEHGVDLATLPAAVVRIREAAERAKIDLSSLPSATVEVSNIYQDGDGLISMRYEISLADFEKMTATHIAKMIDICARALANASLSRTELDAVILVGGMTNVPAIKRAVEAFAGKKPLETVNPFEVVAVGAAIEAARLDGRIINLAVGKNVALTIGLKNKNGAFIPVIGAGEPYGTTKTITVTTMKDAQVQIAVDVRQGNSGLADRNQRIELRYVDVGEGPAGSVGADVTINVDENGIVSVEAEEVH